MALWTTTQGKILRQCEVIFRRLTGASMLTATERVMVNDALNMAILEIQTTTGIDYWKFANQDITVVTVAAQSYVNLSEGAQTVLTGTVRIPAENKTLGLMDLERIHSSDPNASSTGLPDMYAVDGVTGSPNKQRLLLWPIPDGVYTIALTANVLFDENSVSSFPSTVMAMLRDKTFEIAFRDLGLYATSREYAAAYLQGKSSMKDVQRGHDGALYVSRPVSVVNRSIESRIR